MADLLDGVLCPTVGAEPVGARVEVRLKDRLHDQLDAGLHDPVCGSRDTQGAHLAARLGDHRLADRSRPELLILELGSKIGQKPTLIGDQPGWDPVDAARA